MTSGSKRYPGAPELIPPPMPEPVAKKPDWLIIALSAIGTVLFSVWLIATMD
jgi:hypothetical protein